MNRHMSSSDFSHARTVAIMSICSRVESNPSPLAISCCATGRERYFACAVHAPFLASRENDALTTLRRVYLGGSGTRTLAERAPLRLPVVCWRSPWRIPIRRSARAHHGTSLRGRSAHSWRSLISTSFWRRNLIRFIGGLRQRLAERKHEMSRAFGRVSAERLDNVAHLGRAERDCVEVPRALP